MGFFNFLRGFVDFLEGAWNQFIYLLGNLVSRVIQSITNWLDSVSASLKSLDIILTTGTKSYHISNGNLQSSLRKRGIVIKQKNESEQAAILRNLVKSNAEEQYYVPLTQQEKTKWGQTTKNTEELYQIQNY
ncbi:MAG: hypothetical protein F6J86_14805 [Symploca sp. SIO1B1]|nr:hypothetical protein [Symploca sp. SIO1B1]